jgi:hypothetical protein
LLIATGFSANLDYMHADNGYLVSWRPVEVGTGSWPYPPEATWADPDLDEAAADVVRRFFAVTDAARFSDTTGDAQALLKLKPELERLLEELEAKL